MNVYLLVGLGSAIGGMARHGVTQMLAARSAEFPWGTMLVNVAGSLAIGAIAGWERVPGGADARQFLTVGLLGGFTTFSAFSAQTVALMKAGKVPLALLYAAGSVVLCVAAAALGMAMAQRSA